METNPVITEAPCDPLRAVVGVASVLWEQRVAVVQRVAWDRAPIAVINAIWNQP